MTNCTRWLPAVLLAFSLIGPTHAYAREAPQAVELAGRTMGTTYRLKYWGDGAATPVEVHGEVESLLDRFDRQMSTYRDDSELSRFNQAGGGEWVGVSAETAHVVAEAIRFCKLTDGALDVTVAPLSRLWKFGPDGEKEQEAAGTANPTNEREDRSEYARQHPSLTLPIEGRGPEVTKDQIAEAMQLVGVSHLNVRADPPALWKDQAEVEIDLSAIAPGYAVDLIIDRLRSLGFAHAMVEIGGEVRGVGVRPDGKAWRVGVERAGKPSRFIKIVPLDNLALTTAGDYRNLRSIGGKRYTHIIDPRTGEALLHRGVAVTVLAKTAIEADALDTALVVMGATEGFKWCVEHEVAALFQTGGAGGEVRATPRFEELITSQE